MKKIIFLMAAAAMAGGVLTSCKDDTQPRLEQPTEFHLNTPPTANDIAILAQNDEEGSTIDFSVSQPNYGVGTPTHYEVQVSYTRDFTEMYALPTVGTQAKIKVEAKEFAVAMNALNGILTEEDIDKFTDEPRQVFVRVRAFIPHCDYSSILSNVISIWAKPFFAVRVPAKIYLIGACELPASWNIDNCTTILDETENGIDSNIYSGVFTIAKGEATFRFYSKLGDWENNSIGTQNDDNAIDFKGWPKGDEVLETDVIVGKAEKEGKGSWNFPDWPGGKMKITVDLNTNKAYFEVVELAAE